MTIADRRSWHRSNLGLRHRRYSKSSHMKILRRAHRTTFPAFNVARTRRTDSPPVTRRAGAESCA